MNSRLGILAMFNPAATWPTPRMFDLTDTDIQALNDDDLRVLVRKLCEAELQSAKLSVSAIIAGGHQDAADGGIDVRVTLAPGTQGLDFVRRPSTGFQVKKPSMPHSEILNEMCPSGVLRQSIIDLGGGDASYIIVSSGDSCTDPVYRKRVASIRGVLDANPQTASVDCDFYDRNRLAVWANQYYGLKFWVYGQTNNAKPGWRPYETWTKGGVSDEELLADDNIRLVEPLGTGPVERNLVDGLGSMRQVLSEPRGRARLIGLSGSGKTRVAQALFDSRIGTDALAPALAVYCDFGHSPDPSPRRLADYFARSGERAVLVVDNCSPETHRELSDALSAPTSACSLLTIEYDVGDDFPEGTDVFRLNVASDALIGRLLACRFPDLGSVFVDQVVSLSGGNARIALALALALTLPTGRRSLAINDKELFSRLFHQRQDQARGLEESAQVLALVYSYDGESIAVSSELAVLSQLTGGSAHHLYNDSQQLITRDLVQKRSHWRAVLPQALAIHLAADGLHRLHPQNVVDVLATHPRLFQSFTRRLGYLCGNPSAVALVKILLADRGLLGDFWALDFSALRSLKNVAPVSPNLTLEYLKKALADDAVLAQVSANSELQRAATWILKGIAYDEANFLEATRLLAKVTFLEDDPRFKKDRTKGVTGLFQMVYSGTHATLGQRTGLIQEWLKSSNADYQYLGLESLSVMLEVNRFHPSHEDFGSRQNDGGYMPKTVEDRRIWLSAGLAVLSAVIDNDSALRRAGVGVLCERFQSLWMAYEIAPALDGLVQRVMSIDFVPKLAEVFDFVVQYNTDITDRGNQERIRRIDAIVHPEDLFNRALDALVNEPRVSLPRRTVEDELRETAIRNSTRMAQIARELVAAPEVFSKLKERLWLRGAKNAMALGEQLALATDDVDSLWKSLVESFKSTRTEDSDGAPPAVLYGVLTGAAQLNPTQAETFLDAALADDVLAYWVPHLSLSVPILERGANRLLDSLDRRVSPAYMYSLLRAGGASKDMPVNLFVELLRKIIGLDHGMAVAIEIFSMRIYKPEEYPLDTALRKFGLEVITSSETYDTVERCDYDISQIIRYVMRLPLQDGGRDVCAGVLQAAERNGAVIPHFHEILQVLFETIPPTTILDMFLAFSPRGRSGLLWDLDDRSAALFSSLPQDGVIRWANEAPSIRFSSLATVIPMFDPQRQDSEFAGWTSIAVRLIRQSGEWLNAVLTEFSARIVPTSFFGSKSVTIEARRKLLAPLLASDDEQLCLWARGEDRRLLELSSQESKQEQSRDERFE